MAPRPVPRLDVKRQLTQNERHTHPFIEPSLGCFQTLKVPARHGEGILKIPSVAGRLDLGDNPKRKPLRHRRGVPRRLFVPNSWQGLHIRLLLGPVVLVMPLVDNDRSASLRMVVLLQPDAISGVIRPLSPNRKCGPISDLRPSMLPDPIWPPIYIPRPTHDTHSLKALFTRKKFSLPPEPHCATTFFLFHGPTRSYLSTMSHSSRQSSSNLIVPG
jgi:hypothetical protein